MLRDRLVDGVEEAPALADHQGLTELIAGAELVVERLAADACGSGYLGHRHLRPGALGQLVATRIEQPVAQQLPDGTAVRRGHSGRPVAGEHAPARPWMDVRAAHVATVVGEHPGVHHAPPQRREQREQDHPGVAGRQLRRLVEMAQRLVASRRVGVVVGVALQVVEQHVGGDVVAVPAVLGRGALVAAVRRALAQQPVVLEVVDDLQQREADDRLDQQVGQHDAGRTTAVSAAEQHDRHRPCVEDVVARWSRRAPMRAPAARVELPR